jgi:hypothetical protein
MRGFFVFNGVVGIFTKGNLRFACIPKMAGYANKRFVYK